MKTQIKKALVSVGIFAAGFVVLDLTVGAFGNRLRERLAENGGAGETAQTAHALTQLTTDVLILGSSRAAHHYDPEIVSRSLKMSAHNAGRNGTGIPYHNAVLWSVIDRQPPAVVILDVNPYDLDTWREDGLASALGLKPYYYSNDGVRRVCDRLDPAARVKMLSAAFRYNTELFKMGAARGGSVADSAGGLSGASGTSRGDGAGGRDEVGVTGGENGFLTRDGALPPETKPQVAANGPAATSDVLEELFEEMIELCRARGVRLAVAVSPIYKVDDSGEPLSSERIEAICRARGVEFFGPDGWFLDHPELFADAEHLNPAGAEIYTRRFLALAAAGTPAAASEI